MSVKPFNLMETVEGEYLLNVLRSIDKEGFIRSYEFPVTGDIDDIHETPYEGDGD